LIEAFRFASRDPHGLVAAIEGVRQRSTAKVRVESAVKRAHLSREEVVQERADRRDGGELTELLPAELQLAADILSTIVAPDVDPRRRD
jgi:hypothetical protein